MHASRHRSCGRRICPSTTRRRISTSGISPYGDIQFEHNRRNSFPLEGVIAGGDITFEDTNSIMFEDGSSGRLKSEDYSEFAANTYFLLDDNTSHLINEEYFEARLVQEYSENIITENGDNIVLEQDEPYSDDEVYATYGLFTFV